MRPSGPSWIFASELLLGGAFGAALSNPFEGAHQVVEERARCNANNCLRAVIGTAGGLQPTRLADCSSFMQCLVTPVPVIVTDTVTASLDAETETVMITVTDLDVITAETATRSEGPINKRTEVAEAVPVTSCPSAVPTYASACSGTVRYSSACSCGGVTQVFSTLGAPISTVTSTVTETPSGVVVSVTATEKATSTVVPLPGTAVPVASPNGRFRLRTVGGEYGGLWVSGSSGTAVQGWIWHAFGASNAYFTINSTGVITDNGYQFVKQKIGGLGGEVATPYDPNDSTFGSVTFTTVSSDGGDSRFAIAVGAQPTQTRIQVCAEDDDHPIAPWIWLGSEIREDGACAPVALEVVPLSP